MTKRPKKKEKMIKIIGIGSEGEGDASTNID
jgi:hypothetical protein